MKGHNEEGSTTYRECDAVDHERGKDLWPVLPGLLHLQARDYRQHIIGGIIGEDEDSKDQLDFHFLLAKYGTFKTKHTSWAGAGPHLSSPLVL